MQTPYFTPLDFLGQDGDFSTAITDKGLCHVYNGDVMRATFAPTKRMNLLVSALDRREAVEPKLINGTRKIFEKYFLLNVADRYEMEIFLARSYNLSSIRSLRGRSVIYPRKKTPVSIAINEWLSYFDVRMNFVELLPGQQAVITVEPVSQVASEGFRRLSREHRGCLFREEALVEI